MLTNFFTKTQVLFKAFQRSLMNSHCFEMVAADFKLIDINELSA